jgi:DNA-binding NtrC family response regulator
MDTSESVDTRESMYTAEAAAGPAPLDQARRAFEHEYLVQLLTLTEGNVTHAARHAGRNRTEFYRLLRRHGLLPASFKRAAGFRPRSVP